MVERGPMAKAREQRLEQLLREAGEILTLLAVSGTSGEPISLGNDTPSLDQLCYLAARIRAEVRRGVTPDQPLKG